MNTSSMVGGVFEGSLIRKLTHIIAGRCYFKSFNCTVCIRRDMLTLCFLQNQKIQFPPFAYIQSYDGFFLFSIFRNFAIISRNK